MKTQVFLSFLLLLFAPSAGASAGERVQMIFEDRLTPDAPVEWMVTAEPAQRKEAEAAFQKGLLHARDCLLRLHPANPDSETSRILSKRTKGTFTVSSDLARILATTREVAKEMREPLAKKISVNLKTNQVTFKTEEVLINIEPVLKGYLADLIMEDIRSAGFLDSMLNLDGIYVATGDDFNGPWKIPVADETTKYAHRTFFYKARNTAAATVDWHQGGAALPTSDLKSVTIFSSEGALKAQAMATATYVLGVENARKFLESAQVPRAVLIDYQGQFIQIPKQ